MTKKINNFVILRFETGKAARKYFGCNKFPLKCEIVKQASSIVLSKPKTTKMKINFKGQ